MMKSYFKSTLELLATESFSRVQAIFISGFRSARLLMGLLWSPDGGLTWEGITVDKEIEPLEGLITESSVAWAD